MINSRQLIRNTHLSFTREAFILWNALLNAIYQDEHGIWRAFHPEKEYNKVARKEKPNADKPI